MKTIFHHNEMKHIVREFIFNFDKMLKTFTENYRKTAPVCTTM